MFSSGCQISSCSDHARTEFCLLLKLLSSWSRYVSAFLLPILHSFFHPSVSFPHSLSLSLFLSLLPFIISYGMCPIAIEIFNSNFKQICACQNLKLIQVSLYEIETNACFGGCMEKSPYKYSRLISSHKRFFKIFETIILKKGRGLYYLYFSICVVWLGCFEGHWVLVLKIQTCKIIANFWHLLSR